MKVRYLFQTNMGDVYTSFIFLAFCIQIWRDSCVGKMHNVPYTMSAR